MWNLKSILVDKLKIANEPKYFINRMFLYVGVFIPSSGSTPKLLRWLFQFVEQFLIKALNCKYFNPFAPEPPVTARADPSPFYLCDVISFNGQRQLCPLTCAEWRDLSNHTEGDMGVYGIAILRFFSSGISVILILTCGIAVSSSPAVFHPSG